MAGKLTQEEIVDRKALFDYVKKLLGYDDNMTMPKHLVNRLNGMQKGQFIANNNIETQANYSFKVILYTFMANASTIKDRLSSMTFNSEQHKINYVMSIIDKSINDIYIRLQTVKKVEEQIERVDIKYTPNKPKYQKKEKPKSVDLFSDDDF